MVDFVARPAIGVTEFAGPRAKSKEILKDCEETHANGPDG